ncbi:dihydrofolate reductase family protein [Microbacterium sp. 179-B 1A2 NHS]|uniref:dihydrofolate reductase family protein n=1 Tax=Microbacterium sp. 179-B 1A2 NHS TaxID=3142383 RepID=UPI00399FA535
MTTRGRIVIDLFTTLDGVAQAPGGPDEDARNGFRFGGWQAPFPDDMVGEQVSAYIDSMDALLLGRRTYDIFAAYWPHHTDGPAGSVGRTFDRVPKYVASRSALTPAWAGTVQLGPDVPAEVDALRDRHRDIHVVGSVGLVQTLLAAEVYDELRLWVHPVVLGEGRRVFPDGAAPATLRLIEPPLVGDQGVVQLRYAPAGPVRTGDMDEVDFPR